MEPFSQVMFKFGEGKGRVEDGNFAAGVVVSGWTVALGHDVKGHRILVTKEEQ